MWRKKVNMYHSNVVVKQDSSQKLKEYKNLITTIAKIEYSRISQLYLIDFNELVAIGTLCVHTFLKTNKKYNISYISTAIKWSIRNELRRRYKWYKAKNDDDSGEESHYKYSDFDARDRAYSAILSINELEERDNPVQFEDTSSRPDELCELKDLSVALKKAIKVLSDRERSLIESRFYNNKKIKDLAEEFNVSQSRISRIIQSSLNRMKKELAKQGID